MFDLGTCKLYVGDLSPHWQSVAKNLNPDVVMVWVVFYQGQVFGVYLSVTEAAKAVSKVEAALSAGKKPQPQSASKALLERRMKEIGSKAQGSSGTVSKP